MHLCIGRIRTLALLLLAATGRPALAQGAVVLPDTPPGRAARAWIDVVNSGDSLAVRRYLSDTTYAPPRPGDPLVTDRMQAMLDAHRRRGTLVPVAVQESDSLHLSLVILHTRVGERADYIFYVEPLPPHRLQMVFHRGGSGGDV